MPVRARDVALDGLAVVAFWKRGQKSGNGGQTSVVFVFDAALKERFAFRVTGEEGAVVVFYVGVAMPAGSSHVLDIKLDPFGRVITLLADLLIEDLGELEIDGVFSGAEIVVIMNVALSPEAGLVV